MKRIVLLLLIFTSIIITIFIQLDSDQINDTLKNQVEIVIVHDSLFPARPVWWSDGKILAVGILPDSSTGDAAAQTACDLLVAEQLPVSGLRIEVYDVLKIQNEDEWSLLGFAVCE
ncbi:MAG: hypothetical protein ACPHZ9_02815 [Neptunomonas phycophila]